MMVKTLSLITVVISCVMMYIGASYASNDQPGTRSTASQAGGTLASGEPRGRNLASHDLGGTIEAVTSEFNKTDWSASRLIDGDPTTGWASAQSPTYPQEIVFSFLDRQPALIAAVIINPSTREGHDRWAKDVEIWISMDNPDRGFAKVAEVTLRAESVDQDITFAPVEARYIKLRILSNHGSDRYVELGKVQVIEA